MARQSLDINIDAQRLLAANKERAASNRAALEERKNREKIATDRVEASAKDRAEQQDDRSSVPDLYRPDEPAAQRRKTKTDLIPVWVSSQPYRSNIADSGEIGLGRTVFVHTGQKGLVRAFQPLQLAPLAPVANSDAGLVAVYERDRVTFGDWSVNLSEWQGNVYASAAPVFRQVINGKLYYALVRGSYCYGRARVLFDIEDSFGAVIGTLNTFSPYTVTASRHDLWCCEIDLSTGAISYQTTPLYDRQLTATKLTYTTGNNNSQRFDWSVTGSVVDLRTAIGSVLPSTHPFAACAQSVWDFLAPSASCIPSTALSFVGADQVLPSWSDSASQAATATALMPAAFSPLPRRSSPLVAPITDRFLGYNTGKRERIVAQAEVLERSKMDAAWPACSSFAELYQYGPTSFRNYDPANLKSRASVLTVSGLTAGDQSLIKAEPAGTPPPAILPAPEMTVDTKDVYFLRENSDKPSFIAAGDWYSLGYILK